MTYPATLQLDAGHEVARWRPLVHWLLVIPHAAIANVLGTVSEVLAVVSWFIIVFTGRLPEGLANLQCLVLRYTARTYSYALWLREPYPAFQFETMPADPGGDPLRVDFQPALEGRNRLTVGLRFLWIIPVAIVGFFIYIGAAVVVLVSFFAVLFTGTYPAGMRDFVVGAMRFGVRLNAYAVLLTDEYPPFNLQE
jgi:hypothetical protein